MLSMITPPVCLASYAAASIGKTDPVRTGWEGMRLCAIAYVVPFLFVFSPSLLLIGHWWEVALSVITAIIGAILLGVALVGYLFRPVGVIKRILFLFAATGLLIPILHSGKFAVLTWASNSIGLSAGDLACISGVASAFVSRPRANEPSWVLTARSAVPLKSCYLIQIELKRADDANLLHGCAGRTIRSPVRRCRRCQRSGSCPDLPNESYPRSRRSPRRTAGRWHGRF